MELCCKNLSANSRRYQPNVPGNEQWGALVQFGPMDMFFIWLPAAESFSVAIFHCPWCGADLSTLKP